MTTKNIGARNAKTHSYDKQAIIADSDPENVDKRVWSMLERQLTEALEWYDDRGNVGDNVPVNTLERMLDAVRYERITDTIECAVNILETQMHPTARDIVGNPAKQAIYNLTPKRANEYRSEN